MGRRKKKISDYQVYQTEIDIPEIVTDPFDFKKTVNLDFSMSVFIRMLYSCLVDADFLDTEAFMSRGKKVRNSGEPVGVLLEKLEKHVSEWLKNQDMDTVNGRRTEILKHCLEEGRSERGLFRLTVPTGGGKTIASLAFALRHAVENQMDRVIYVIPYTSIIEQNAKVFREILGDENVLENHCNIAYEVDSQRAEELQPMQLAAENWDKPVVVTTNVQFFESLFANKPSKCRKLHNIANSVIIFDEVQLFPYARQAIKYLVADGRYEYIETGSLISIRKNVKDILIPSEEYRIKMYPMDFEEYLWALNDTVTIPAITEAFQKRRALGDAIHRKIMKTFRTYMVVGGMPQAVEALVSGKTFAQIDFVKRNILSLYEEDLSKYDNENREKASVIYKTLPEQLENKNSHFKFSLLDKNARYQNYVDAVSFIAESMIGNECINVTKPEVSLELFADRSNFKLYMGDTGLLVTQVMKNRDDSDEDLYKSLIVGNLGINQGMILENMVAQMLRASGHDLYFHEYLYRPEGSSREKKYEIDFMTVKKKKICPIEVKSSGYTSHKSFDYLIRKYQLKMEDRYIIYTKDLKYQDGILYLPIYMTMLI